MFSNELIISQLFGWLVWFTDTWWTSMKVYALAIISLFLVLASVHKWYQKTLKWFYSIGLKGCWDIFFSSFPIENNDSLPNYLNLFSVLSFNIHKSKGLNLKRKNAIQIPWGDFISQSFSILQKMWQITILIRKQYPTKREDAQDSDLTHFWGGWSPSFLRLSHLKNM